MYLDNETIRATQIHKDLVDEYILNNKAQLITVADLDTVKPRVEYVIATGEEDKDKQRYYSIYVAEHKIGFVPAKRFGTILDPTTRNRTCVPLIFAAKCYFEKSIKTMSEFDLTNCLHTFPQKLQYADPCPGEPYENGYLPCNGGMRLDGKTVCTACKGTGFKVHNSSQDIIQIRMPKTLSEIVELDKLIAYKAPPIDLLEFQKKYGLYELRALAQGAVYNSDVFSRSEIAKTATEKTIDLDAVYDTLRPFADSWSEMYIHIYKCIAEITDISEGLTVIHEFPNDFKMESFGTLLDYLQKATQNGAPSHIKKAITRKITNKVYIDDAREILRIDTKDRYFPFPGKSESEINYIIANDLTTDFNKIFYAHFDMVFSDLEYEAGKKQLDFYDMSEEEQRKLIANKVNEIITNIAAEGAAKTATSFNNNPDEGGQGGAGNEDDLGDDGNGGGGKPNPDDGGDVNNPTA